MFLQKLASMKARASVICAILFLGFAPLALQTTSAFAAEEKGPFDKVVQQSIKVFKSARQVVFVIGGFGLVGLAGWAMFGDLQWKWFFMLAFGLILVATAGTIIDFLVGGETGLTNSGTLDTL